MRLVSWKSGNAIALCVCVMAIVVGQFATAQEQELQEAPAQQQTPPPAAPSTQKPPQRQPSEQAAPAIKLPDPIPGGPNIKVDITITDQAGSDPPAKKTLSVIAADRASGSIRSLVTVAVPTHPPGPDAKNYSYERLPLNVDVKPEVTRQGQIRVQLILNYETYSTPKGVGAVRSVVTANQWVMLENGKPMTVSQSADAASDRKVSIELTATVLK
jgi:hypothetical protein